MVWDLRSWQQLPDKAPLTLMMEAPADKKATVSPADASHPMLCSESSPPESGTSAVTVVIGKPKAPTIL